MFDGAGNREKRSSLLGSQGRKSAQPQAEQRRQKKNATSRFVTFEVH
jgi:hypothetical protein